MTIQQHDRYEWTPEAEASLKALYADKHGCRAIASTLVGFSYAAVERRIRRLIKAGELEKREAVPFQGNPHAETGEPQVRKERRPPPPPAIGALNTILEYNVCHHIEADSLSNEGARMCGHPGFPYCEYHQKYMYIHKAPTPEEREEAARKSLEAFNATFGRYGAVG